MLLLFCISWVSCRGLQCIGVLGLEQYRRLGTSSPAFLLRTFGRVLHAWPVQFGENKMDVLSIWFLAGLFGVVNRLLYNLHFWVDLEFVITDAFEVSHLWHWFIGASATVSVLPIL